ncbi:M42 family metallopeptidase [Virgibacillus sp. NKC19-3]|uniref:M42 family metallopeptidase n=1 Tax=Virgibacillus saliphilus TaxID=2831674 RepID=UPI001C9B22DE|nr:M42 family metallopeptidase [Virgibacillus sp. NKC19-3]MBY7144673.1 M42 family metallopeptidase [Virgibacillus sp. NKC19-3]
MEELLKQLSQLNGPCGYEQNVTYFIEDYVKEKVDHVQVDGMGNVIASKKGGKTGPTTLLTAHMDEVGFIIKKIESNGLLRFEKLGGHDDRILLAQQVNVLGSKKEISGIIGTLSVHFVKFDDPKKVRPHSSLYIDIGATSAQEVRDMGVEVGTPVTWATESKLIGSEGNEMMVGKALDDRSGCAVLLTVLDELQDKEFAGDIIFLFTVQEEVGLRGAQTAINQLEVDAAIAVDTTAVSDTPEDIMDQSLQLSGGAGIKVMDFSLIVQKTMKDLLIKKAQEAHIDYQLEVFPGIGTDGGAVALSNKGIPTGVLSIPSRYTHSPVELISMKDVEATKSIMTSFILDLDEKTDLTF